MANTNVRVVNYEGMFLIGQAAAANFGDVIAHIRHTLERHHATIIAMKKWDERRLAFEIQKQKRGIYILCYFSVDTKYMGDIERSLNLSESVMRHLMIRADHMTLDEMKSTDAQKELEAEARLRAAQPANAVPPPATPVPAAVIDDDEEMI
jgi:small subunit ribosomal protein S6